MSSLCLSHKVWNWWEELCVCALFFGTDGTCMFVIFHQSFRDSSTTSSRDGDQWWINDCAEVANNGWKGGDKEKEIQRHSKFKRRENHEKTVEGGEKSDKEGSDRLSDGSGIYSSRWGGDYCCGEQKKDETNKEKKRRERDRNQEKKVHM